MRPSTQSTWPVIHSDRSEKRNAAMAPTSRGSPRLRAGVIASTACRNSSGRLPRCIGEHQPRREAVRFNPCLAVLASDVPGEGSDRRLRCLLRWAAVVFQRAGDADAPPRTTLRLGTGKQSSGRTGPPSSKPQPMSELRNHPRKLTPNSATSTRTEHHPLRQPSSWMTGIGYRTARRPPLSVSCSNTAATTCSSS